MVSFSVDPEQLIGVHNQLVVIHANMQSIGSLSASYDGQLGSPAIDAELATFAANWSNGFLMIQSRMVGLLTHLAQAAEGYLHTEAQIRAAAGGSSGGGGQA